MRWIPSRRKDAARAAVTSCATSRLRSGRVSGCVRVRCRRARRFALARDNPSRLSPDYREGQGHEPPGKQPAFDLSEVHAAVDVENVAGDIGGFVAGKEYDGGGNVAGTTHAAERNARLEVFLDLVWQDLCHGCLDKAWSDGVHGDITRGDFDADGLGEADQAGFSGNVIGLAGVAGLRDDAGDVDDAARARLHHRRQRLLDAEMRAGEVGANDGIPVLLFHAHGQAIAGDGGVVDENIEPAEFLEDLLEAGFDLFGLGDIHFDREGFAAARGDFGGQRGELFFVASGNGDLGAGLGESQSGVPADSLRRTGDDSDLILEAEHGSEPSLVWAGFFARGRRERGRIRDRRGRSREQANPKIGPCTQDLRAKQAVWEIGPTRAKTRAKRRQIWRRRLCRWWR